MGIADSLDMTAVDSYFAAVQDSWVIDDDLDDFVQQTYAWLDDFVVKRYQGQERAGTLDYLTPDLKSALVTLHFSNLGIFKVAPEAAPSGAVSAIRTSRAEMYCEALRVDFKV